VALEKLEILLSLNPGDIQVLFCDLASIVNIFGVGHSTHYLRLYHASLGDFLLDRSRSRKFHIDAPSRHTEFAHLGFQKGESGYCLDVTTDGFHKHRPSPVLRDMEFFISVMPSLLVRS